jgi:hypothetical protein
MIIAYLLLCILICVSWILYGSIDSKQGAPLEVDYLDQSVIHF